jgi:hypothetical protein
VGLYKEGAKDVGSGKDFKMGSIIMQGFRIHDPLGYSPIILTRMVKVGQMGPKTESG